MNRRSLIEALVSSISLGCMKFYAILLKPLCRKKKFAPLLEKTVRPSGYVSNENKKNKFVYCNSINRGEPSRITDIFFTILFFVYAMAIYYYCFFVVFFLSYTQIDALWSVYPAQCRRTRAHTHTQVETFIVREIIHFFHSSTTCSSSSVVVVVATAPTGQLSYAFVWSGRARRVYLCDTAAARPFRAINYGFIGQRRRTGGTGRADENCPGPDSLWNRIKSQINLDVPATATDCIHWRTRFYTRPAILLLLRPAKRFAQGLRLL